MEGLFQGVFDKHMARYLNSVDATRLAGACRATRKLVFQNAVLKEMMDKHVVLLRNVEDLKRELGSELVVENERVCDDDWFAAYEDYYTGEWTQVVSNEYGDRMIVNDFNHYLSLADSNWVDFARTCPYPFCLLVFPPLGGTQRFKLGGKTFHRGFCAKVLLHKGSRRDKCHTKSAKILRTC